jgi:hypothetical protein
MVPDDPRAALTAVATGTLVLLPCGDGTYSVSGPLSKGKSLGIAESLGCE